MKKILIVEDDFFIRDIYTRALKEAEYEVDQAVDGKEGLEKLISNAYDLILLDIMLPHINGLELLKNMRTKGAQTYETPVYLITNVGQDEFIQEAFKLGAEGYLIKAQIKPQDLINEINRFFANPPKKAEDSTSS